MLVRLVSGRTASGCAGCEDEVYGRAGCGRAGCGCAACGCELDEDGVCAVRVDAGCDRAAEMGKQKHVSFSMKDGCRVIEKKVSRRALNAPGCGCAACGCERDEDGAYADLRRRRFD